MPDRLNSADQLCLFSFLRHCERRHMRPSVMGDLMSGISNLAAGIRIGFDRMPRNEPRAGDVVRLQQRQETLCADHAELPP